jgi:phosphoenolpyruvate phosphomutase
MEQAARLRALLAAERPVVLAGAHNGLSARLVAEAGFDAVWASGFEISASHALPDANILTMAENLAVAKNISDSVTIPVIADCDNGYGNAINVVRMVEEFEKAGIAGVCIEDNIFPKRCSFYTGVKRELETIEEFVGKIRAAKRTQRSSDFVVIARTEALIAGWGIGEALKRGEAYAQAGADLIVVHSKSSSAEEVMDFAAGWTLGVPLVAIPTTYNTTGVEELAAAGFKMVIFANHGLRASIRAMRETLSTLRRVQQAAAVEDRIAPLQEVYGIIGVDQLRENEAAYLPVGGSRVTAVIVAAGVGFEHELTSLIADRPKAMLDVKGKTILERQVQSLNDSQITNIIVVRGYKKEKINLPNLRYYDNDRFRETHNLASLFCADAELHGPVLFLYGDILFDQSILDKLLKSRADITLVVDHAWYESYINELEHPVSRPELVRTQHPPRQRDRFLPVESGNRVLGIARHMPKSEAHAEFIGMAMFSERGIKTFRDAYQQAQRAYARGPFHEAATFEEASFGDLVQELIDQGQEIACLDIYKGWMEVDTFEDYRQMWAKVKR